MGLFNAIFGEKSCGVCGKELGLLGKRKLEDGYICKDCAAKLSPFFSDRRQSTLDEIKQQLAYREENQGKVASFHNTKTLGTGTKVLLDEDAGTFLVSPSSHWRDENPDIIAFSQVTGCTVETTENRSEVFHTKEDGSTESYDPPRYDIDYDVWVTITVDSPWFDEIRFRVNESTIEERGSVEMNEAQRIANEVHDALTQIHDGVRQAAAAAAAPKVAQVCPHCGATTIPDANGCCEYCGGAMGQA